MHGRARASFTAWLSVALGAACSSQYVAVAADGGAPAPDASAAPTATTTDAALPPPPLPSEAGIEAGPPSPCAGASHLLCVDFDTTKLEAFTRVRVDSPGTLAVSTALAVSGTGSLLATLPRRSAADASDAFVRAEKTLLDWRRVKMDFDVRLETADFQMQDGGHSLAGIFMSSGGDFTGALLFTDGVSTAVSIEGRNARYYETEGHLGAKRWVHVSLDFDPRGRLAYSVDGKSETLNFAAPLPGPAPTTELAVGISSFEGPSPSFAVHYDNVVVDYP